jgi:6-phosphogluconolactonase (cycloisomerase 2 family)
MPRHFTISQEGDDDIMFVVDQNGNTLETFLIDENTGKLTKKEMLESGNNPTFVGLL